VTGVELLRWTDFGLVVQTGKKLILLDLSGHQRVLADVPPGAIVLAAKGRLLYFSGNSLFKFDLARGLTAVTKLADRDPVTNAELSADGSKLLFATAKRVYLMEGDGEPKTIAGVQAVRSLCFSPDANSYLWSSGGPEDAVVRDGKTSVLPSGARSVRFSQDGRLVLTMQAGVYLWDTQTGTRSIIGGISIDDGINIAGDIAGKEAVVALYSRKSAGQKEHQTLSEFQGR
jgi:hypothetical protein